MDVKNKTAIVGGGSGLIGRAVCKLLKEQGAKVINADICADEPVNCGDAHDIYNLLKLVSPSVFVNCCYPSDYHDHLMAFLVPLQIISKDMWFAEGGVIVNVSSVYGMIKPFPWVYPFTGINHPEDWYCEVKKEIIKTTREMAKRFAPHVRINCVSPGGVYDNQPEEFMKNYAFICPLERMATPEEIAWAILFLIKHDMITGVNLPVTGGMEL